MNYRKLSLILLAVSLPGVVGLVGLGGLGCGGGRWRE